MPGQVKHVDSQPSCTFCQIVDRKIPAYIIDENDAVIVFLSLENHALVVPKEPVPNIYAMSDELAQLRTEVTDGRFNMAFSRNTDATDVTMIIETKDSLTDTSWSGVATNANGTGWSSDIVSESGSGSPVSVNICLTSLGVRY